MPKRKTKLKTEKKVPDSNFDRENYFWKNNIDYRVHPELYKVGDGDEGTMTCQPYKDEIGPYWKFQNTLVSEISSERIYRMFLRYLEEGDFIGADLSRKYLHMGYSRSQRYADYKGGKKYNSSTKELLPSGTGNYQKAICAHIFLQKYLEAENNPNYRYLKEKWKSIIG